MPPYQVCQSLFTPFVRVCRANQCTPNGTQQESTLLIEIRKEPSPDDSQSLNGIKEV